jgi:hypothetical protein
LKGSDCTDEEEGRFRAPGACRNLVHPLKVLGLVVLARRGWPQQAEQQTEGRMGLQAASEERMTWALVQRRALGLVLPHQHQRTYLRRERSLGEQWTDLC